MKKTVLEIYALAVCFVTLVCFVVSLGIGVYSVIQIANPEFTMTSGQYDQYQSNDAFWSSRARREGYRSDEEYKKMQRPSDDELTKKRQEGFAIGIKSEQRDGAQSFVKVLIVVLINIAVFFAHWVIARRARVNVST
jgi:hypothetical protein